MRTRMGMALFLAAAMLATAVWAHKGMKHPAGEEAPSPSAGTEGAAARSKALEEINEEYVRQVKLIFLKKCFDCHGSGKPLPWYARIPGPKQLIRYDIRTARKHLVMDKDFPFGGHASQLEQLKALEEVVQDGSMPPWRYRIMHRDSALGPDEAATVRAWISEAKKTLGAVEGSPASGGEPGQEVGR